MIVLARDSRLSRLQVEEVFRLYPGIPHEVRLLPSYGDKHKDVSLLTGEAPADIFTRELDAALLSGAADVAVHSAKDLPYPLPEGIDLIALLPAFDTTDALVSRGGVPLADLPAGSRVGTSSALRKRGLEALRPDLVVQGIRGTIEERVAQVRQGRFDAAIVATCALKRLGMEADIAEVLPFPTHPLQGYLALTARTGRDDLRTRFAAHDMLRRQGTVTLVGFGPGAPDLLTLRGEKALREADVIYHDDLLDAAGLQRFPGEKVYVGKRAGRHHAEQDEINRLLLAAARAGRRVVRLKGGDPLLYSHAGEELEFLHRCFVRTAVVPGITAVSALAAAAQVPLTHRLLASTVSIHTAHGAAAAALHPDPEATGAYYMSAGALRDVAAAHLRAGAPADTPVVLGYNVSRPDEQLRQTTLSALRDDVRPHPTPLVALVGDVCALTRRGAADVRRTLYLGSVCPDPGYVHTPLLHLVPVADPEPLRALADRPFDYTLFTSRYAVTYWLEATGRLPGRAVSIGPATSAALRKHGVENIIEVTPHTGEGVTAFFGTVPPARILFPRSDLAPQRIPDTLRAEGHTVETVVAYLNRPVPRPRRVDLRHIRRVVFTSPSTVDRFFRLYGALPQDVEAVAIGPTTRAYLEEKLKHTKQ